MSGAAARCATVATSSPAFQRRACAPGAIVTESPGVSTRSSSSRRAYITPSATATECRQVGLRRSCSLGGIDWFMGRMLAPARCERVTRALHERGGRSAALRQALELATEGLLHLARHRELVDREHGLGGQRAQALDRLDDVAPALVRVAV